MPVTDPAVAVKLPVLDPAATDTEAGAGNAALLADMPTDVLPVGAEETVTVQVDEAPDTTVAGEHARLETVMVTGGGVTVTDVVLELPFSEAVRVTA